uniref:Putative transcriptional regulator Crp/Fnr family protein n=1 Tax=uncultured bacterium 888 TaxID=548896 RepID=B8R8Q2_9BACT|nr:putative transcriptional regulator Crp/Fnr family protein [uncultured bacterium 888]
MGMGITRRTPSNAACLAGLPRAIRARLAPAATLLTLKRGQVLVHTGDKPTGIYALAQGRLDLVARVSGRAPKVLDILRPGQSFGEAFLFLGRRFTHDVLAAVDSIVWYLAGPAVLSEIAVSPECSRHMLQTLSRQLLDAIEERQSHALSGTQRFAQLLLRYAVPSKKGPLRLKFPARKTEMASRIDLSPEHLSRLLRTLSDSGLISVCGSMVEITDPEAMRTIARGRPTRARNRAKSTDQRQVAKRARLSTEPPDTKPARRTP